MGGEQCPPVVHLITNKNKTKNLLGDTVVGCCKKEELRGFVILIGHHILYIYAFQPSILDLKNKKKKIKKVWIAMAKKLCF